MMDLSIFIPLAALVLVALANLFYHYRIWLKALRKQAVPVGSREQGVSVIISARNQARHLEAHLPVWLSQTHPNYELVVVNDCSYDETADLLLLWQQKDARLKVVTIEEQPKYPTGKKFALTLGVKAASFELLLFTDADSYPADAQWISSMQQFYVAKTEMVLGIALPEPKSGLLPALARYDAAYTALQMAGHGLSRKAYMATGKNLSYLRSLFFFHKGYVAHIKHAPGDDDLFVNLAATPSNVRVNLQAAGRTYFKPDKNWTAFWQRKVRLLSNLRYYQAADRSWLRFVLGMQYANFLLGGLGVWWLWGQTPWMWVALAVVLFTWLHRLVFTAVFMHRMGMKHLIGWLPVLQPMHQLLQVFWSVKGYWAKPGW